MHQIFKNGVKKMNVGKREWRWTKKVLPVISESVNLLNIELNFYNMLIIKKMLFIRKRSSV